MYHDVDIVVYIEMYILVYLVSVYSLQLENSGQKQ